MLFELHFFFLQKFEVDFFKKDFIYLFMREREERERETETQAEGEAGSIPGLQDQALGQRQW